MSVTLECVNRGRWRELTPLFRDDNYRQLWDFGVACAERVGAASEHVAMLDGPDVVGLADVRIRRVPLLRAGIAYINGGPLVRQDDGRDAERFQACLTALADKYVKAQGLLLRIAPPPGTPEWQARQEQVFAAAGFHRATHGRPYRTFVLAIHRPLEDIRRGFEQKWRNGLNRSERNGLTVRGGESDALFHEFCDLYQELQDRKGFEVDLDAGFYRAVQRNLGDGERFSVSIADFEGRPVAGHVSSMLGDTCVYLLGASNETGMDTKASYLLQWHAIQAARQHGCRWYDLGGIDPDANPGTFHFKQGLGGEEVAAPGPFEIRPPGPKGLLAPAAERCYHLLHRRRRGRSGAPAGSDRRSGEVRLGTGRAEVGYRGFYGLLCHCCCIEYEYSAHTGLW